MKSFPLALLLCWNLTVACLAADPPAAPSEPVFSKEKGVWEFTLPSEFQAKAARVQVLLPEKLDSQKRHPVLYILPVDSSPQEPFGNGLAEVKKADFANKYGVICVYPFIESGIQWYGNHATKPGNRQEDFMVKTLVPTIDTKYPTRPEKESRWLLGFSKSGWGAYTLLMRNRKVFGYAAAWDVPFMINGDNTGKDWGPMGLSENYGAKEAMQPNTPSRLAPEHASWLRERNRLVLGVGSYWAGQCKEMHALLEKNGIPHTYRADLLGKHSWDSGWFAPIAEELQKLATASKGNPGQ